MKFGIGPINKGVASPDEMIESARLAESAGIESVWTFEHVVIPVDYESRYPYSADGRMSAAPETNYVDPLIGLAAIAAETSRLRLGTGVNILPQANPLLLAKQAASLDFVSRGRFMLGVGIGWLQEEFAAMGTPFERRGARFDDYLAAMRKVWSGDVVEHDGEFLTWHGFKSYPLPVQSPLPVHIGGNKGKAFERVARYGNGWYSPSGSPTELAGHLAELRATCDRVGRNFDEIEITAMWTMKGGLDGVKRFADIGVHRLTVPVFALWPDDAADRIRQLGDEIVPAV
ncbi:MAG: TIGR03619 family F420-dependent LLM class oxidoreductase [Alphaproteobacteria bacterium]|nr:TIGR03619 family F420-dependent LLM class oxidoreductase [Alphaproteobacteria bacterium]